MSQTAASDFDQDQLPDRAELFTNGAQQYIHIAFGNTANRSLSFISSDNGFLLAGDLDHDSDQDLVWVSLTNRNASKIWLGDGHGNFALLSDTTQRAQLLSGALREPASQVTPSQNETEKLALASFIDSLGENKPPFLALPNPSDMPIFFGCQTSLPFTLLTSLSLRGPPALSA